VLCLLMGVCRGCDVGIIRAVRPGSSLRERTVRDSICSQDRRDDRGSGAPRRGSSGTVRGCVRPTTR
jgi:hypothetical protein